MRTYRRLCRVLASAFAIAALATPAMAQTTPMPTQRDLFLRNTSSDCAGYALNEVDGADPGNGCSFIFGSLAGLPGFEEAFVETYPLDPENTQLPITLDASRPITGQLVISSITPNAYVLDVVVTLGETQLPAFRVDGGAYTGSWFFDGGKSFPLTIPIPPELDKKDITDASVKVIWRRYPVNAVSTWTELDDPPSKITVPAYTESFTQV
jgi:hypothetical protein